jgi:DNA repair protein RecN (Recombination protein N)
MLQSLHVRNLAIVDDVRVEFGSGLNVITGETGAGKSVILGALGLVLGERADRSLIRSGEDQCQVEAEFVLAHDALVRDCLEQCGLPPCEDGRLIIRRSWTAAGSGKAFVNDASATVQALKRIGDLLVDTHGPHDHQSLLKTDFQLDILDAYGHLKDERARYEAVYRRQAELLRQRDQLIATEGDSSAQLELLSFQIKEIDDAGLDGTDEDSLRQEHSAIANAHEILQGAEAVVQSLTEGESSAFNAMVFVNNRLDSMAPVLENAADWRKEASAITVQIRELAASIESRAQGISADPERLQWLEDRLAVLHRLKRKYGHTVPEILSFRDRAKTRLQDITTRADRLTAIDRDIAEARRAVETAASRLSAQRTTAARSLGKAITRELAPLGFPHGVFQIALSGITPGPTGADSIEFGFAPNAGETMRALRMIASSGEISRVMLATKAILAAHDRIPVLIFDEIDANVGGEMATAVGNKLATVANSRQVLCITHLPQVAVQGATHFAVTKAVRGGRTFTAMHALSPDERVEEVSRMLGGKDLTSVTKRHAREMLRSRQPSP